MSVLKTRAAVIRQPGQQWEIAELDLDGPRANEVLVRFMASGLCHSDEHVRNGDAPVRLPMVGGHEGAGVVEAVGPGVTRLKQGDHVVTSFITVCGRCRYCSTGRQSLCVEGARAGIGCLADGTYRFHAGGQDYGAMCVLGTFSRHAVLSEQSCIAIGHDIPFDLAALVGCGVTTGWCSAVNAAGVRPGDTVVVFGIGGVGINALQGARYSGARNVVAIDPVAFKLEMAKVFGATHLLADPEEAHELVREITDGQMAEHAILTVGLLDAEVVRRAVDIVGKGGQVTITSIARPGELSIQLPAALLIGGQRRIQGALFGASNPLYDIPRLLDLYRSGDVKLDELVTQRYRLEQLNDGYQDMLAGKNIRGVIVHEH
jgi:NDMA-dependent alcohol dehydrogenase